MVTIIMAAYNGECYIKEQLESIKNQSYSQWKLIIRDDGSLDKTRDMIKAFQLEVEQEVILLKNNSRAGSAKYNFFRLLEDADGDYIMFCDQDDIWKKDKILKTLNCMQELEESKAIPVLIHSDLTVVDEACEVREESFFVYQNLSKNMGLAQLLIQNFVTGCTMMINQSLQKAMLEATERNKIIMHDYWAALYAKVYGKIGFINESTMYYRQHRNNSVGAKASKHPIYLWKRLLQGRMNYKVSMKDSIVQVQYFLECYKSRPIELEKKQLLQEYAALLQKSKWYRIKFYHNKKVLKQGKVRVLMQYLWG